MRQCGGAGIGRVDLGDAAAAVAGGSGCER